jgi:hypothetical protein
LRYVHSGLTPTASKSVEQTQLLIDSPSNSNAMSLLLLASPSQTKTFIAPLKIWLMIETWVLRSALFV